MVLNGRVKRRKKRGRGRERERQKMVNLEAIQGDEGERKKIKLFRK